VPYVRGRIFAEVESTGRPKRTLDVLIWGQEWLMRVLADFNDLETLREYLRSIRPSVCAIRYFVPGHHAETIEILTRLNIICFPIECAAAKPETGKLLPEKDLADAGQTALACDADVLVVSKPEYLPYLDECEDLGIFLTDTSFLKHYCELFVRGHDVPWSFAHQVWGQTWNGFYHFGEPRTLSAGHEFLYAAQQKSVNAEARETGRSLVHNRLPNICFTRDRLLFYEIQKLVAHRNKWKRQEYAFESSYYLNFYYPLIFGGFDHCASLVNQTLQMGMPERNVGATYGDFLSALQVKNVTIHGIFIDPKFVEFHKRISFLRHYAAHRGSLAPAKLLKSPAKEPTEAELDAMIAEDGEDLLDAVPDGKLKESFREILRFNFKMRYYEEQGTIAEEVVWVEFAGKRGFITPTAEIYWTFQNFLLFINSVFAELMKCI